MSEKILNRDETMKYPILIVIGLDGATWEVIDKLIQEGKLPTLKKLKENGVSGALVSSIPPITFPAWKCYSSGKNPGKLGVFWFLYPDFNSKRFIPNDSTSFKSYDFWDLLSVKGYRCGILDMPGTYPPKKINGFMISWGAPKQKNYTYPADLAEELENKLNYKIDPEFFFDLDKDKAILATKKLIENRFETAIYLAKKYKPDFFHITIFHIDSVQHVFWRDMLDEDSRYRSVIEDFWVLIDNGINKLLEECTDENTRIILMSDHGFTGLKAIFNLTGWLEKKGYITLKKSILQSFLSKVVNRDLIFELVKKLRLVKIIRKTMPKDLSMKILDKLFPPPDDVVPIYSLESAIDWEKSKIIPLPEGPIYVNPKIKLNKNKYKKLVNKLISEMKHIKNPKTGEQLFKQIFIRDEVYTGRYVNKAPDIILLPNDGYEISTPIRTNNLWVFELTHRTGTHKTHGIFIAYGPDIRKGYKIKDIKIYDIAPTILHIFGLPIPNDMDGRVLMEIFEPGSELAKREPKYVDPSYYEVLDEKERLRAKIQSLKLNLKR